MLWDSTPLCLAQPPRSVTIRQSRAINERNAHLKAAKSGHSLTLVSKPLKNLVVKYDHELCMYSKLKDGSMRRVLAPLRL